jgi:hypothetical protein
MKKRAIHSAKDYDEFRNMVACAELKPVESKELSNLMGGTSGRGFSSSSTRASKTRLPRRMARLRKDDTEKWTTGRLRRELTASKDADAIDFVRVVTDGVGIDGLAEMYPDMVDPDVATIILHAFSAYISGDRMGDADTLQNCRLVWGVITSRPNAGAWERMLAPADRPKHATVQALLAPSK